MATCPFNPNVLCDFHTRKSDPSYHCDYSSVSLNALNSRLLDHTPIYVGGFNLKDLGYLDLINFSTFVCKLFQKKSMCVISNCGVGRATHVVARILKSSKQTIRLFCSESDLKRFDVLNLSKCLESSVSVYVLLESISDESQNLVNNLTIPNEIHVKVVSTDGVERMKKILGSDRDCHMMIGDDNAFRLEQDSSTHYAMSSFSNPSWCRLLTALFDYEFFNAAEL